MRSTPAVRRQRLLFETPEQLLSARTAFEGRVRDFARAVALRHRRKGGDTQGLLKALAGYYDTLALFATSPIPPLDDAAIELAIATYAAAKIPPRRREAA